jgi:hypothetical protein
LISLSFRDFIFDPKCLPTAQRSLIRHPGAIFLTLSSLQILKSIFSHLPDRMFPRLYSIAGKRSVCHQPFWPEQNPSIGKFGDRSGQTLEIASGTRTKATLPLYFRL